MTKTDGVPLFVEELTGPSRSRELKDADDRYEYIATARRITVPATLRNSLMARLDRVADVKRIAQVGSVIGREFGYDLVAEIVKIARRHFPTRCRASSPPSWRPAAAQFHRRCTRSSMPLCRTPPTTSLLKSQRMTLHGWLPRRSRNGRPRAGIPGRSCWPTTIRRPGCSRRPFPTGGGPGTRRAAICAARGDHAPEQRHVADQGVAPGPKRDLWSSSCARCWAPRSSRSMVGRKAR